MFLIKTFFDFSKYDLLMLQIQQMTIFSSLQAIKYLETLKLWDLHNNLEHCILSFLFLKKKILLSLGGLFNNIWIILLTVDDLKIILTDCALLFRKIWAKCNLHNNVEHSVYIYVYVYVNFLLLAPWHQTTVSYGSDQL